MQKSVNNCSLRNQMLKTDDIEKKEDNQIIYLTIDHLKKGNYILNIMLKNKVLKSIQITKET